MWWNELTTLQQWCFIIGCAAGGIMIVQIILMLIGFTGDEAFDGVGEVDGGGTDLYNAEHITSGLRLISLRTAIAFLCMGSWVTFAFLYAMDWWWALLIGLAAGAGAGLGVALVIKGFMKLQSEGNIIIENCLGKTASVYLTVPAKRSGQGKVYVYVQETNTEFEAVTDAEEPIKTGSQCKVVAVVSQGLLRVEPL